MVWPDAVAAFAGGLLGGSGGVLAIYTTYRTTLNAERQHRRQELVDSWRAGIVEWEAPLLEGRQLDLTQEPPVRSLLASNWYRTLRPSLPRKLRRKVQRSSREHSLGPIIQGRHPIALELEERVVRIEKRWRLR